MPITLPRPAKPSDVASAVNQALAGFEASLALKADAAALAAVAAGLQIDRIKPRAGGVQTIAALADTWNDADTVWTAIGVDVTNLGSSDASRLIDMKIDGASIFSVRKGNGGATDIVISSPSGASVGGISRRGSAGEMALTSQIDPNTGHPADVVRWYWDGAVGTVAALHGMGTNRLSIESEAAIVHIAKNSRFEWEGWGAARLAWITYQAASAYHKGLDITNAGTVQDPLGSIDPILSVSTVAGRTNHLLSWGTTTLSAWTELGYIDNAGGLHGTTAAFSGGVVAGYGHFTSAPGTSPVAYVDVTGDTYARLSFGLDAGNSPSVSFGPGNSARDIFLARAAAETLEIRGLGAAGATFGPPNLTGSAGTHALSITPTWNTTGSPTALLVNATNTASGSSAKLLDLCVGGSSKLSVDKAGNVTAAGAATIIGQISSQFAVRVTDSSGSNGFALYRGGTGKVGLWDHAGNAAGSMFIFGPNTNGYAGLKRDAATNGLQARLGDDSGFTWLQGKLRTDSAYSAGAPTATGFLTLYDANGTAYKVPAVAA